MLWMENKTKISALLWPDPETGEKEAWQMAVMPPNVVTLEPPPDGARPFHGTT